MLSRRLGLRKHDDDEDRIEEMVPETEMTVVPNDFVNPDRPQERLLIPEVTMLPSTPRTPQPPKEEGVEDLLIVSAWAKLFWNFSLFWELSRGNKPSNRLGDYGVHVDYAPSRKRQNSENGKKLLLIWGFVIVCVCLGFFFAF